MQVAFPYHQSKGPDQMVVCSVLIFQRNHRVQQTENYTWHGQSLHRSIMEMPVSFTPSKDYPKRRNTGTSTGSSAETAEDTVVANSMMRKVIASRLKESYLDAPAFFLNASFSCDNLVAFRNQMKAAGQKVSYNDLVIKSLLRKP